MKAIEIREKYLKFFEKHNHKRIPSASLIPENDPSVLFTTAGMQPLVPYLLGQKHPEGTRLTDYQKCVRTNDIEEVGDNRHLTFFEMLGNWSLGDYFKEESIAMSFEFLTKELGIPVEKISVTCFAGDEDCERDTTTAECWKKAGIAEDHIYFYGKDDNWWIAGEEGPCGPDTEMFYDTGKEPCGPDCQPSCDCGKYVEIWNNVFMQFLKKDGKYTKLPQQNVDTGMGLERITFLLEGKKDPFETELFAPVMEKLQELATNDSIESRRIAAEHLRSSMMIIADGGRPSNVDRGYVLRRIIRRMTRHLNKLGIDLSKMSELIDLDIDILKDMYQELDANRETIKETIIAEQEKFMRTLERGEREFTKVINKLKAENKNLIDADTAFNLYETYGFPPEITRELAKENNFEVVETAEIEKKFKEHQEKSKAGSEQKFKGGLSGTGEQEIKYHTATHLLNAALRVVISPDCHQKGSNITPERMRFDFNCDHKLTDEEKQKLEDQVNAWIEQDLPVSFEEMNKNDAAAKGAEHEFLERYPDIVKVYTIGDVSMEICGGPHVEHTGVLGHFKIKKEEASSAGIRRIKAILE